MQDHAPRPRAGDVLVMVGTRKGVFFFWSDAGRRTWQRAHHHLRWSGHAVRYDERDGTIYAATNSAVFDALVQRSDDGGATWQHVNQGLDFGADESRRVREVWQVQSGHPDRPGEVWAGSREAGLFHSADRGVTWRPVASLNDHATKNMWNPGGGGLILHTIVVDPDEPRRLYACISAGGAYRSDDKGVTWRPVNKGVRADFMPFPDPEAGHCVHKMVMHPGRPNVLFQQNHCGMYRSDDRGESWVDTSEGLPSRFGFPMAMHPHDPHTAYVVPLTSDERRFVPDGQMAVWRTWDDGNTWEPLAAGLPSNTWLTILREGLTTDPCDPAGIYVGTTTGQVFYSRDEGSHWDTLADYLPPVLSVSAARAVG